MKEKLLNMELHDEIQISGSLSVIKVPGGWIYKFFDEKDSIDERPTFQSAVFVSNINDTFYQIESDV
jgi:hypothetical protein